MKGLQNIEEYPEILPKSAPFDRRKFTELRKARAEAEKKQLEGLESQDIFKKTVESKLIRAGAEAVCASVGAKWFGNFQRCGNEKFYIMCGICRTGHEAHYQCSLKWCPRCNWRIAARRREELSKLTNGMAMMKHVVLTQRNFDHLTREKILATGRNIVRLREQEIFAKVTGGCCSLEFTNENNGWHMHWHLLVQSKWIDAASLSVAWGKLVGQEFAIVKVMDVTEKSYLQEICKYVVDGSELARWTPSQILEFVSALHKTQLFRVFGKFKEMRKFLKSQGKEKVFREADCACKSGDWVFGHDAQHCKRRAEKMGY